MKRLLAYAASASALIGGALAQDEAADDGAYVRIGGGATFLSDHEREFTYPLNVMFLVAPAAGRVIDYKSGYFAGAALGFDYADGIRTELEYRYAVTGADTATQVGGFSDGAVSERDGDMKAHFIFSNFYFDFTNSSRITPFIGGGVGGAFTENELGQRDGALAYQGRAGLSLALGGGFSADAEYIYVRTNRLDYGPNLDKVALEDLTDTAIEGDHYEASNVMLSIRKQF